MFTWEGLTQAPWAPSHFLLPPPAICPPAGQVFPPTSWSTSVCSPERPSLPTNPCPTPPLGSSQNTVHRTSFLILMSLKQGLVPKAFGSEAKLSWGLPGSHLTHFFICQFLSVHPPSYPPTSFPTLPWLASLPLNDLLWSPRCWRKVSLNKLHYLGFFHQGFWKAESGSVVLTTVSQQTHSWPANRDEMYHEALLPSPLPRSLGPSPLDPVSRRCYPPCQQQAAAKSRDCHPSSATRRVSALNSVTWQGIGRRHQPLKSRFIEVPSPLGEARVMR